MRGPLSRRPGMTSSRSRSSRCVTVRSQFPTFLPTYLLHQKHIAGLAREVPQKKREDAPTEVVAPVDPVKATSRALSTAATNRASPGPPQYKRPIYQTPSKTYKIVPQEKAVIDDPYNRRRQLDKPYVRTLVSQPSASPFINLV